MVRFGVTALVVMLVLLSGSARAQDAAAAIHDETRYEQTICTPNSIEGKQIGDFGFCHQPYHDDYYTQIFKDCPCGTGECRVTKIRPHVVGVGKNAEERFDVLIDRKWYLVTDAMLGRTHRPTSQQAGVLDQFEAHACAPMNKPPNCVYIKGTKT